MAERKGWVATIDSSAYLKRLLDRTPEERWGGASLQVLDEMLIEAGALTGHLHPDEWASSLNDVGKYVVGRLLGNEAEPWINHILRANKPAPVLRAFYVKGFAALDAAYRLGDLEAVQLMINKCTEQANAREDGITITEEPGDDD